jgi:hypothetical protein
MEHELNEPVLSLTKAAADEHRAIARFEARASDPLPGFPMSQ